MKIKVIGLLSIVLIAFGSCKKEQATNKNEVADTMVDYSTLQLPKKPNILWLVAEDLSPYIPSFGDSTVVTPNLSRLAAEGVRYPNFFSPSGVCAPSRAAIALGMYPTRTGAMHMRTGPWWNFYYQHPDSVWQNRRIYEAIPPAGTHMHSTYMREAGYYATNNSKEDYQFRAEMTGWDDSSKEAHWRNRTSEEQPFFSIFNFGVTHESQIWARAKDSLWVPEDLEVNVPPYLPNTEIVRNDLRRMYSNIKIMDKEVGDILKQLEEDGELENTIIFWYGDHGGMLPRSKRTMYDTGINTPLIVRFPNKQLAGMTDKQLLSFSDLKPTIMSIAGIEPPSSLDGQAWVGSYHRKEPRKYVHSAADDFDGCCHDRVRAVRDNRYKLIRNYLPDRPYYLAVDFREQMPSMQELLKLNAEGKLDEYQVQWFRETKDSIELFDTKNDPFELHNVAEDPLYQAKLQELSNEMDRWIADTEDKGLVPEQEYLKSIWPNGKQPITAVPQIEIQNDSITITCATDGASIGYQWIEKNQELDKGWSIYEQPLAPQSGKILVARAHRIGYVPSESATYEK